MDTIDQFAKPNRKCKQCRDRRVGAQALEALPPAAIRLEPSTLFRWKVAWQSRTEDGPTCRSEHLHQSPHTGTGNKDRWGLTGEGRWYPVSLGLKIDEQLKPRDFDLTSGRRSPKVGRPVNLELLHKGVLRRQQLGKHGPGSAELGHAQHHPRVAHSSENTVARGHGWRRWLEVSVWVTACVMRRNGR